MTPQSLTTEQVITVSAFTGFLICDFSLLHEAIEKKLGRPVFTHELADPDTREEVKAAFMADFIALQPVKNQ